MAGLAIIVLATLIAYIPAIRADFIWNDNTYVYQNRLLAEPSLANLGKIWSLQIAHRPDGQKYWAPYTEQYYPIVFTTFWLESQLWTNTNPCGFHVVNILLHAANAVLVWFICRRLGFAWGFFAGLVFALHPVEAESVVWITERKNVLSGLFYFLALLAYLRFDRDRNLRFYFAALICFILALLSKTVTCTLPAALLLLLWLRHKRLPWRDVPRLIPFLVIGAALGLLTAYLERHSVGATGAEWQIHFWQRCVIAGRAIFFYLCKLLWPANLSFIYPRWEATHFSILELFWPLAAAALTVALWYWRKTLSLGVLVAWSCFVITLFPALGFFDVYPFRYSFVADHFQYLASVFAIALFVGLAHRVYKRFQPKPFSFSKFSVLPTMLAAAVLCLLAGATYIQASTYIDARTLWQHTTRINPQARMAWNNLGAIHLEKGNLPQAETCFRKALELRPDYAPGQVNYAAVLIRQGTYAKAVEHLLRAIELQHDHVAAHLNLAKVYAQVRKYELAISTYKRTIALANASPLAADRRGRRIEALSDLSGVYAETGQYVLAVDAARRAVELARRYGHNDFADEIEPRLRRYRRLSDLD